MTGVLMPSFYQARNFPALCQTYLNPLCYATSLSARKLLNSMLEKASLINISQRGPGSSSSALMSSTVKCLKRFLAYMISYARVVEHSRTIIGGGFSRSLTLSTTPLAPTTYISDSLNVRNIKRWHNRGEYSESKGAKRSFILDLHKS